MIQDTIKKIHSSINLKFIITFILCLIIPLLILGSVFSFRFRALLMNKEIQYISDKINISSNHLNTIFQEMNDIINSLILNHQIINILESEEQIPSYEWFQEYKALQNILQSLSAKAKNTYGITIISHNNKLYECGSRYNNNLKIYSPIIERILEAKGETVIINRLLEGSDDNDIITLGRAVRKSRRTLGVILVDVPSNAMNYIFDIFDKAENKIYILQEDGSALYAMDKDMTYSPKSNELKKLLNSHKTTFNTNGIEYLCLIQTPKSSKISIVVLISKKYVFKESSKLIFQLIIGFFIIISATICIIITLSTKISENIRNLSYEVSRFGTSDCTISIVPNSTDEVGQLTKGFITMTERINNLLEQIEESERNRWELEFKTLQSQVNPHMIYNTLNTITYLAQLQNVPNIEEVSSSFSFLLRNISNHKGELISIQDELDCLRAYISIKKYNLLWDFDTDFEINPIVYSYGIPKLLLQPLVENSIVHGFSKDIFDGQIIIKINLHRDRIQIDISDNGKGMDRNTIKEIKEGKKRSGNSFTNVGVYNTIQRLKFKYGNESIFVIDSQPDQGTTIHIEYPAYPIELKENI